MKKMKVELRKVKIKELISGYSNDLEEGVSSLDGKLDIRPKYQREFVYKPHQRNAVIETVLDGFPLNSMYWVKNIVNKKESFEVLDGQQRTISICEFAMNNFSIEIDGNPRYFDSLNPDEKSKFLDYELMVFTCEGNDSEKLKWFQKINIAGEKLTDQELLNSVYTGEWLTNAKSFFSKTNCPAYLMGQKYMTGSPIRQEFLEKVLSWKSNDKRPSTYMAIHQHDKDANELIKYFKDVMEWIQKNFTTYRKEMKNVEWGLLYNDFKNTKLDPLKLESEVSKLMEDEDVTNKKGIYSYVLSHKLTELSIRNFDDKIKRTVYEKQKGICLKCKNHFKIEEMEADHKIAWSKGGKTTIDNCQMLCKKDNRDKSSS